MEEAPEGLLEPEERNGLGWLMRYLQVDGRWQAHPSSIAAI
jgi:hypothetical protein